MNHIVSRSDGQTMSRIVRKPLASALQSSTPGTEVLDDGSMLITAEQLARFGGGDAKTGRRELRLLLSEEREGQTYSGPTEKPVGVRAAMIKDEEAIVELLMLDLAENAAHIAPIEREKVLATIQMGTRNRGGVTPVVDGPDGKPVAVTCLHPCNWWFSHGWYWFEIFMFVHPDHRKSKHAESLMSFNRWWSDAQSRSFGYRQYLICGVLGGWRIRAKTALYRRKFQQAGSVFCYPSPPLKGN